MKKFKSNPFRIVSLLLALFLFGVSSSILMSPDPLGVAAFIVAGLYGVLGYVVMILRCKTSRK